MRTCHCQFALVGLYSVLLRKHRAGYARFSKTSHQRLKRETSADKGNAHERRGSMHHSLRGAVVLANCLVYENSPFSTTQRINVP